MKKTVYKIGDCELILHIDKHGVWTSTLTPNLSCGFFPHNPIKQLLYVLSIISNKLIEVENEKI